MTTRKLRILDLFSGIGGFSLGLERTGGFRTMAFCEIEPFRRAVLRKHWPTVHCYDDITKFDETTLKDTESLYGKTEVICGGFPCQDISSAGKGAGLDGERSGLWREYARVIEFAEPRWIIIENSPMLRSRGLVDVLEDLFSLGYDAEWHCIPASAIGAPHRRDRIWIVAYPSKDGRGSWRKRRSAASIKGKLKPPFQDAADTIICPSKQSLAQPIKRALQRGNARSAWRESWSEHLGKIRPLDDGIPGHLDRLAALGDAIVPQIAEIIGRAILEAERGTKR